MTKDYSGFIDYFTKNGFETVPYLLKVLSYLPPSDRCRILESLLKVYPTSVKLYDKLSMALLKNGEFAQAKSVLFDGYKKGLIDSNYYGQMVDKIEFMHKTQGNNFGSAQDYQTTLNLLENDRREINGAQGINWDRSSIKAFNDFYTIMQHFCNAQIKK